MFLKPGRGKTACILKVFDILKKKGYVDALLVIAPLRVITTSWPHQIEYWEDFKHLTYVTIHGGEDNRKWAMEQDVDVYLMNLEGLIGTEFMPECINPSAKRKSYRPNEYAYNWFHKRRVMLVCDESTKFKNSDSLRFKSLACYLPFTARRAIMTGTPRPGKLENLFSQCYITDLGADLGQFITHFRRNYMRPDQSGYGYEELPGAAAQVAARIAHCTVLSDVDDEDMPTNVVLMKVKMPDSIRDQYNELKREFLLELGDDIVMAPNSGVLWGKLRQFAQGAIFLTGTEEGRWATIHDAKLDVLENILEELDGEPAFCLYAYRHDFERINQRLEQVVPRVGGGISAAQGAAFCKLFAGGHLPLLLGHPDSVALGVDGLQNNCSNIIWFGNDPSWEKTYQANLRVARPGNKASEVTIYKIMLDCSVEHAILQRCSDNKMSEAAFLNMLRAELTSEGL